jgi:hypothetical protein
MLVKPSVCSNLLNSLRTGLRRRLGVRTRERSIIRPDIWRSLRVRTLRARKIATKVSPVAFALLRRRKAKMRRGACNDAARF